MGCRRPAKALAKEVTLGRELIRRPARLHWAEWKLQSCSGSAFLCSAPAFHSSDCPVSDMTEGEGNSDPCL